MKNRNLSSRTARGAGVVGVSAIAAVAGIAVAAAPASASQYATGWECISPFLNYTNGTYPEDPPAPDTIQDSLAIGVARTSTDALSAKAGRPLALHDLQVSFDFKDPRPIEALYTRTATLTTTWSNGIPLGATDAPVAPATDSAVRSLSLRTIAATGVIGDPTVTFTDAGDTTPTSKPVAGERWWSYNVTGVDPASAPTNAWYTDGAVNASTGKVTRTYYTEKKDGNKAPRTKSGGRFSEASSSVGHKYVTHTGDNRFPVNASVVVQATNTVEGTQTLHVEGSWVVNVQDSTPGTINDPYGYSDGGHTVKAPVVRLNLPSSRWTPTGAGPVEFRLAAPGNATGVVSRSTGYDRPGYNRPQSIKPYGNVWARFETESYGSSHDCIPGDISVANTAIPANPNSAPAFYGDARPDATAENPDRTVGDLENPGFYKNGQGAWTPAIGSRGRFAFAPVPQPAIATAPLEAPAVVPVPNPTPTPAPYVAKAPTVPSKALKRSKSNKLSLKLTNPNTKDASFTVSVKTKSKYRVGKSRKVWTVGTAKKTVVGAGKAKTLKISLTKAAKTLLKTRKSLKVVVTIKATDGKRAKTVKKTLTIKR